MKTGADDSQEAWEMRKRRIKRGTDRRLRHRLNLNLYKHIHRLRFGFKL